jgi:hypothetical protein
VLVALCVDQSPSGGDRYENGVKPCAVLEEAVSQSPTAVIFLRDIGEAREAKLLLEQSYWKAVVISEPIPISGGLIIIDEQLLPALHEEAITLMPDGRVIIVADSEAGKVSGLMAPEVYMLYRPYSTHKLAAACRF